MTTDQSKPPYPYRTWIDCAVDHIATGLLPGWAVPLIKDAARKELKELRARLRLAEPAIAEFIAGEGEGG
jgi:hypothetical protein